MILPTRQSLDAARARACAASLLRQMIAAPEELDWKCYRLYGLLPAGAGVEHPDPPDHLQQATALAAYYLEMKDNEGWEPARLQPLLAGLLELLPWLEQWHNEIDPAYGERMGTYYRGFVNEEARALGFTLDDLRSWKPAATPARRGRKKAT